MTCFRERTRVKIGVFYGKKHALINSRERPLKSDINLEQSSHVETVCLLSKKNAKPKDCVEISVDAEDYYRIKSSEKDI